MAGRGHGVTPHPLIQIGASHTNSRWISRLFWQNMWRSGAPGPSAVPRVLQKQPSAALPSKDKLAAHPIIWRVPYPQDIVDRLVTYKNPGGDINNSDLELAGGVFQHYCAADSYGVRKRTVLSRTDNSSSMWWIRKGSATCTSPPQFTSLQIGS